MGSFTVCVLLLCVLCVTALFAYLYGKTKREVLELKNSRKADETGAKNHQKHVRDASSGDHASDFDTMLDIMHNHSNKG